MGQNDKMAYVIDLYRRSSPIEVQVGHSVPGEVSEVSRCCAITTFESMLLMFHIDPTPKKQPPLKRDL